MRRKDREVTGKDEILAILEKCRVLRLGLCDGDKPYVVPLNFGYRTEGGKLFLCFHSAKEGRKIELIRKNPTVCFEADASFQLVTGKRACEWSAEYESVIGEGRAVLLDDPTEKAAALDCIMERYGFHGKPEYSTESLAAVAVIRIDVETVSGKRA